MAARVMSISQESCTALCSSHLLTLTSLRRFGWTTSWGPLRGPTERTSILSFCTATSSRHRASFIADRPVAIALRARHSQITVSGEDRTLRKPPHGTRAAAEPNLARFTAADGTVRCWTQRPGDGPRPAATRRRSSPAARADVARRGMTRRLRAARRSGFVAGAHRRRPSPTAPHGSVHRSSRTPP
jgi:hypothetical protein